MTSASHRPIPKAQRKRAHAMRRAPTESERRLWYALRHRLPVEASHFRRQVSIGPYIVDFCCHGTKLVVEVDGNHHGTDAAQAYDARRTAVLEAEGYRVLRFSNADVWRGLDSVLDTTFAAAAARTPTPDPSPQGGGETTEPAHTEG